MTEAVTGQSVEIDLGTTYSQPHDAVVCGFYRHGAADWGRGQDQVAMNAANTVFDAKRLIGRMFTDPEVQADIKNWSFKVVSGPKNKPQVVV
ncbi:hypothetical protein PsorP6_007133 [Peronosclerospora sorghi]|uniref:Uncharacterized protein n=1 Tax=Peronosclerospora sorghi TaxID=230839 RepID=A0ACC0W9E0_9STRA|nr:hypothetical protein PsorP6_007133 [Peronosclerospora sorghi]